MAWRIAESLKQLRKQINEAYPNRDKSSDGGIGDASHASRNSDHNPWVKDSHGVGVVTAIDIDEDLAPDIHTIEALVTAIRNSRDPRVKYIIYEKRITVSGSNLQRWKAYTGKNPHNHHAHISVNSDPKLYDSTKSWNLSLPKISTAAPIEPKTDDTPITTGDVVADSTITASEPTELPSNTTDKVVVEKEEHLSFFAQIKLKLAGWFTALGGTAALRQYQEDIASLGLPVTIIKYAVFAVIGAFLLWFISRAGMYLWHSVSKRWLTTSLVAANNNGNNTVMVVESSKLAEYEAAGWVIVRRS